MQPNSLHCCLSTVLLLLAFVGFVSHHSDCPQLPSLVYYHHCLCLLSLLGLHKRAGWLLRPFCAIFGLRNTAMNGTAINCPHNAPASEKMMVDDLIIAMPECCMIICLKWAEKQQQRRGSCCRWAMVCWFLVGCGLWAHFYLAVRACFSFGRGFSFS